MVLLSCFVVSVLSVVGANRRSPLARAAVSVRGGDSGEKEAEFGGLANGGNTCYLNSILQSLYHLPEYREGVVKPAKRRPWWRRRGPRPPPDALAAIFAQLDENRTAGTRELTRAMRVDPRIQQDAQEYMKALLEVTSTKLYKGEGKSVLEVTEEEAEDIGESVSKEKTESFTDLSLDLRPTLQEAISALQEPEVLQDKWKTPGHGYRSATKKWIVSSLPDVLLFHLKRFAFSGGSITKLGAPLDFPLDFVNYFNQNEHYRLHAVVVHAGDGLSGHYYAFIDPKLDGRWKRFDDTRVSDVDVETVLKESIGIGNDQISLGAYLLQYKRLPDVTPPPPPSVEETQEKVEDSEEEVAAAAVENVESASLGEESAPAADSTKTEEGDEKNNSEESSEETPAAEGKIRHLLHKAMDRFHKESKP